MYVCLDIQHALVRLVLGHVGSVLGQESVPTLHILPIDKVERCIL